MHLKLKCMIRTQDPHHPYVFGARVVIAHPEQKTPSKAFKHSGISATMMPLGVLKFKGG